MRTHLCQSFFKSGFHLFGCGLRSNLGCHMVQVMAQILSIATTLAFEGASDDVGQIALRGHLRCARL